MLIIKHEASPSGSVPPYLRTSLNPHKHTSICLNVIIYRSFATTVSQHNNVTTQQCHNSTVSQHNSVTTQQCHNTTVSNTMSQHNSVTTQQCQTQCHNTTVSNTMSQHNSVKQNVTTQQCHNTTVSQHTQGDTKEREIFKCVVAVKECIRGGGHNLQDVIFKH